MKNKNIEKIIKYNIENEVPDVLDNILNNCKEKKNKMEDIKKKRNLFILSKPTIAFASFVLIAIFIGLFAFNNNQTKVMDSTIIFDVNPSIELKVDDNDTITMVNAINSDGKKILEGMDLNGSKLNIGINAVIGSMYKNGYINELKNSILVTVDSNDKNKKDKLQKLVADEINNALSIYNLDSAILSQDYDVDDEIERKALEYGISKGKAELLEKIIENNLTNKNGNKYTFDDLVDLNINELNVILNSKNKNIDNVNSSGNASTKAYIGRDKAKEIALNYAKVADSNIYDLEIELDYEYKIMIYEVSFDANGYEYEFEINATSGEIINSNVDNDDDIINNRQTNTNTNNATTNYITRDKAKQIAFSDAGINSNNVKDLSIELDNENGKKIYEVDFEYNKKDYEYDIDAVTGNIINKKVENDD